MNGPSENLDGGECGETNVNTLNATNWNNDDGAAMNASTASFETGNEKVTAFPFYESLRRDPTYATFVDPAQVLGFIASVKAKSSLEFVSLKAYAISVGSFLVHAKTEVPMVLSTYGLCLILPHIQTGQNLKICIPASEILASLIHFGQKAPVMALQTGTKYASWLRKKLGMDEQPQSAEAMVLSQCFYCPLMGIMEQKWIIFKLAIFPDIVISKIKDMFPAFNPNEGFTFTEINESKAEDFLKFLKKN